MYLIQERIQSTWFMLAYDFSITRRLLATELFAASQVMEQVIIRRITAMAK